MTETTYTRDGSTELELVYDLPEANNATVYLKPIEANDGAQPIMVSRDEFDAEFEEYNENAKTDAYLRERARNGHSIQ